VNNPPVHAFEFTPETLRDWCAAPGRAWPAFKAKQILEWLYAKGVCDPGAMTNLSVRERETLAREVTFLSGETVRRSEASDGTCKLLVQWRDGAAAAGGASLSPASAGESGSPASAGASGSPASAGASGSPVFAGEGGGDASGVSLPALPVLPVLARLDAPGVEMDSSRQTECVMIPVFEREDDDDEGPTEPARPSPGAVIDRATACISAQVGCPVGCRFCASGLGGLDGNLSAGRIVEQVWRLDRMLKDSAYVGPARLDGSRVPPRITNVVFMGMGEPLSNFRSVLHAVRTLAAPWGMGISARRITISTVGLPRAIERLANELDLPVTLALSLHAPNDDIRRELIPWAEYTTIAELLGACDKWFQKTGREITLEYTLLRGVNDRPEHAEELARVAKRLRANINLIRYNEVAGLPFQRPRTEDVRAFQEILRTRGLNAHIRRSRGRDIAAACGQLRHEAARAG
jgi:23S rRNA (adenine2503-C2)-methyltransferase